MSAVTVEEIIAAISPRLGRVEGDGDNVCARCPFPDHEDRSASFSLNKKTGLWRCHGRCARKGNAYQLAEALGCLPPARRSTSRNGRVPVVDWGLDAAMGKYGVEVTDKAVVFTITDHDGVDHRRHARYHRGEPRFQFWDRDTGKRTYHAWCSWDLIREWGAGDGIAYIVEGDRDALTLAQHGYPSIGILGIDHFDHAVKDIAAPLRELGIGALVLTADNDEPGLRVMVDWAQKLEAAGFVVGLRILPDTLAGKPIKDTFDAYDADRQAFGNLMYELPVIYR